MRDGGRSQARSVQSGFVGPPQSVDSTPLVAILALRRHAESVAGILGVDLMTPDEMREKAEFQLEESIKHEIGSAERISFERSAGDWLRTAEICERLNALILRADIDPPRTVFLKDEDD